MIGVKTSPLNHEIVREFFQLFKTPWEFYNPDNHYDVLLATDNNIPKSDSPLVVIYCNKNLTSETNIGSNIAIQENEKFNERKSRKVQIYNHAGQLIHQKDNASLRITSESILGYETRFGSQRILHIGYDLFREVSILLSEGQAYENALMPTLDLHIDMLRSWILETGIPLVEIPPIPSGYELISCLTHDVDFVEIKRHFLDHSLMGFLYRATLGSMIDFFKDRASLIKLCKNLKAVLMLPFVFIGKYPDPWNQFENYLLLEGDAPSTFFFIPYKNNPGKGLNKRHSKYRAAKYDIGDVRHTIENLRKNKCEAGVHGIDSWHCVESGKDELEQLRRITHQEKVGIRMHWLYRNQSTFNLFDQAGYHYDSTFGYNETVGFKAGTAQVYRPIGAEHLLELPLHIQDSALFNSKRMHISEKQAEKLCDQIIDSVDQYKGVVTLLWHQRSIGPERLWGDFYKMLLKKLKEKKAWFATAGDVVDWFRIRRSIKFTRNGEIDISNFPKVRNDLPGYIVRRNGVDETLSLNKLKNLKFH